MFAGRKVKVNPGTVIMEVRIMDGIMDITMVEDIDLEKQLVM